MNIEVLYDASSRHSLDSAIQLDAPTWLASDEPWHTTTHCNILQHTVTHYNALQQTAMWLVSDDPTHCNKIMQRTATHYNALQRTAMSLIDDDLTHCNTLQHTAKCFDTLKHTATHCLSDWLVMSTSALHLEYHSIKFSNLNLIGGFQRNVTKEKQRTSQSIQFWDWRHDTPNAIGFTTLKHSGRHCNTSQYFATHCNTLQHIANTLRQHTETQWKTLQYIAIHCNTLIGRSSNAVFHHPLEKWISRNSVIVECTSGYFIDNLSLLMSVS